MGEWGCSLGTVVGLWGRSAGSLPAPREALLLSARGDQLVCALGLAEKRRREGVFSPGARWLGFQNDLPDVEELVCNGLNKRSSAS